MNKRIAALSVTANKAVKEFKKDDDHEEQSDDEDEEVEDDNEPVDEPNGEGTVAKLIGEINTWRRLERPQS